MLTGRPGRRATAAVLACCLPAAASPAPALQDAAPQRPHILDGYRVRPPWTVAGVDVAVGVPAGTVLRAPAEIRMAGVRVDVASHHVGVAADDVHLDGYDFSGWQVELLRGASRLTISSSLFHASPDQKLAPIYAEQGGVVTLSRNTIDGGGEASAANPLFMAGTGGATVTGNLFIHVPNDAINIVHDGVFVVRGNLFDSLNYGDGHTDCVQTFFSAVSRLEVAYNTVYQPPPAAPSRFPGGGNSFVRVGDERGATVEGLEIANNTLVYRGTTETSFANVFDISAGGGKVIGPVVRDNYVDPSGILYGIWSPYSSELTRPTYFGNVDLRTGLPLLASRYNSQGAGVPATPPAKPQVLKVMKEPSALWVLGIAPGGSLVQLSSPGGGILGTAQAGSGGAWTMTTIALPAPDAALVLRATDALGNASAPADLGSR